MMVIIRGSCESGIKWGSECKGVSVMLDIKYFFNGSKNFGSMFLV